MTIKQQKAFEIMMVCVCTIGIFSAFKIIKAKVVVWGLTINYSYWLPPVMVGLIVVDILWVKKLFGHRNKTIK